MAHWINHVTIAAARNGTTSNTVNPASTGTVVTGASFTPTSGNLLVVVIEGAATSTTPTGWTLPAGGSAIGATGLYVWYRTAAGSDTFSTTHNGSNYGFAIDVYEYVSGSTFGTSAAAAGVAASGGAGPTLSGLSGTNLISAAVGEGIGGSAGGTTTWSAGTELADTKLSGGATDGYVYSLAYVEDSVVTSWSSAATLSDNYQATERLVFAVKVAAPAAYGFGVTTPTPRYNTPSAVYS